MPTALWDVGSAGAPARARRREVPGRSVFHLSAERGVRIVASSEVEEQPETLETREPVVHEAEPFVVGIHGGGGLIDVIAGKIEEEGEAVGERLAGIER